MEQLKRPGGELASRPLHCFWVVDCSGSMAGEKIATLNNAIQSVIPEMREAADSNPNAELLIRRLKFSTGAEWDTISPVRVDQYYCEELTAAGMTDMGKAFEMISAQLEIPPMPERALPPVIILVSDGQPTDNYRDGLNKLLSSPWGKKAVKIAISIGDDADRKVLEEFTGNRELVLQADNADALVKCFKWASTNAIDKAAANRVFAEKPVDNFNSVNGNQADNSSEDSESITDSDNSSGDIF